MNRRSVRTAWRAARLRAVAAAAAPFLLTIVPARANAQRGGRFPGGGGSFLNGALGCPNPPFRNLAYDGRFTFARLIYAGGPGNCYYRGEPSWAHGFGYTNPTAEQNLMRLTAQLSLLHGHLDGSEALEIEDPLLFKFPVAYLVEAGYLQLTDRQVKVLHDYLLKGGFIIVDDSRDDFRGSGGWANLAMQFGRILPGLEPIDVPITHPIFHSFFDVPSFNVIHQYYDRGPPIFRGIFQDNDPRKRLLVMIDFNTDISNYWEFSAMGFRPVSESNQAFELGVNYLIYALTH
ncbi:MAG: DUF4159 domain-containing protein [Gemmatimonadota bacterium]|nr:DUF4159 domain-containing protein [Gemmatimonadota bacterium]